MAVWRTPRLYVYIIVILLLCPSLPAPEAEGGSVISTGGPALHNGMANNVTFSPAGVQLPMNHTYRNNWTRMDPWPTARSGHSMVYDPNNGVFIMFGGSSAREGLMNDTWTYNLSTNTWKKMHPAKAPSPMSVGSQMAFDRANGVAVLFSMGEVAMETWTYDVRIDTWTTGRASATVYSPAIFALIFRGSLILMDTSVVSCMQNGRMTGPSMMR